MTPLSLQKQLNHQLEIARERIDGLDVADPHRDWFNVELHRIESHSEFAEVSLEECNARLNALKQLMLLLRNHCVKQKNPGYANVVNDAPDSYLTVMARLPSNVLESTRDLGFSIEPDLLHQHASDNESFDPVSPTAKIVAYLRGLDESLQIEGGFCPKTEGASLLLNLGITDPETQQSMAVLFQCRYHTINAIIAAPEQEVLQIIEFAAGISPRGYQWSQMSPGTIYLESDLPQLMVHKAKLIRNARLAQAPESRGLHHCCSADVLDLASIQKALQVLDKDAPFTMITEGLLLYFNEEELHKFLANMKAILSQFPAACWVTDFVTRQNLKALLGSHPGVASGVKNVFSMTGRDVVPDNPFNNDDCVYKTLASFGLAAELSMPLTTLTSRLKLDLVDELRRTQIVGNRRIWKIRACDNQSSHNSP